MEQESLENYFLHFFTGTQLLRAQDSIQNKIDKTPGFLQKILEYLASQHTSHHFKVITILHPILVDVFPKLDQESQDDLRGGLLNAVVELHTDLKCVSGLAMLIRQIMEKDGPQAWLKPLAEFLKWVQSDDLKIMQAGIQFFIYLLRQTPYNTSNTDIPLYKLSSPLLQTLFQIVAQSQVTETMRQKLLYLVLQVIKTFSFYSGTQDNIVKQCMDATYEIWMSFFVSALQSSLYFHHLTIKKYIMKILVIIYRDMLKYSEKSLILNLGKIWQFTYQLLPLYLHNIVWDQPISTFPNAENAKVDTPNLYYDDDTDSFLPPIQGLALISLQYLSVITSSQISSLITRISIHHLTNALFHYMLINNTDLKNWYSNPTHFFNQGGISEVQGGVRGKVLGILNELIQKYSDLALQAILLISEKFLINHNQAHSIEIMNDYLQHLLANSSIELDQQNKQKLKQLIKISGCDIEGTLKLDGESQRKIQTSLVVLSRFAEDIIVFQSKQQATFDIQSFIKGLSKQILGQEYHPLLRGQSLYCLTRFTQIISIKYKLMFTELLGVSTKCLSEKSPMPVKMVGCKAITTFCRKIQKHKLKFSQSQLELLNKANLIENIITMDLQSDTIISILQAMIQLGKICNNYYNKQTKHQKFQIIIPPQYLLLIFHKFNRHPNALTLFFNLIDILLINKPIFVNIYKVLIQFVAKCLNSYVAVIVTQQKKLLKSLDTDLITQILKILNVIIIESQEKQYYKFIVENVFDYLCSIIQFNEDVQIHVGVTICLKNLIKGAHQILKQKNYTEKIVEAIKNLLKIPTDKTFESASLYSGNLTILSSKMLFSKTNYTILQDAVLKIFRSRTPSVIQSLVLIYSTIINSNTATQKPFEKDSWETQATEAIDFLSSFSIQNRMGLKILIDKWLLQQSLFRGRYTKVSTFMALSKLFLLRDKRIDNLLVIGFNPSHTRVCVDVNAPLKILATLIRCLENEMGKKKGDDQQDDDQNSFSNMKQQGQLDVEMEKFKQQGTVEGASGGLADRENQQGSTCYMSAMLQFYDDGEQCDQTTEQDLQFLKDSSVQFQLGQYLLNFFNYLNEYQPQYFKSCLKGLLKQDIKNLQKYVNVSI